MTRSPPGGRAEHPWDAAGSLSPGRSPHTGLRRGVAVAAGPPGAGHFGRLDRVLPQLDAISASAVAARAPPAKPLNSDTGPEESNLPHREGGEKTGARDCDLSVGGGQSELIKHRSKGRRKSGQQTYGRHSPFIFIMQKGDRVSPR